MTESTGAGRGGSILAAAVALSFFLIGWGAYVRASGAGLQCPDWPLCFNQFIPPVSAKDEYIHRLGAAGLVLVSLAMLWTGFRRSWPLLQLGMIFTGLVILQAVLGGLAVLTELRPWVVTAHLMIGTLLFQLSAIALLRVRRVQAQPAAALPAPKLPGSSLSGLLLVLVSLLLAQIVIGGLVASTGASLACPGFPRCAGSWLPAFPAQELQMLHRLAAFAALLLAGAAAYGLAAGAARRTSRQRAQYVFFLLLLQLVLGATTVLTRLSLHVAVTHALLAQLVLLAALTAYAASTQADRARAPATTTG